MSLPAKHSFPIWLRLTIAITLTLLVALSAMFAWQNAENRAAALVQSQDTANSLHQMTMAGLTGMMITGTIDQREVFLEQIKQLDGVRDLNVARSEAVIKQFGPGKQGEIAQDPAAQEVIRSGKPFMQTQTDTVGEYLHVIKPVIAQSNYLGKNCVTCHAVPEGTVLGTVSMKVSLDKMNAAIFSQGIKMAIASLVMLGVVVSLTYLFIRAVVIKPIESMTHQLNEIASGEGDLAHRLPVTQMDEIGRASLAFNKMMDKFAALVGKISNTAGEVKRSVGGLVNVATQVEASSVEQQAKAAVATASVGAVVDGVSSIVSSADQVRHQSHANLDDSKRGHENLGSLVKSMDAVEKSVNGIVTSVRHFVDSTTQITSMTRQVKDIADQTNLLALNAAIEAARAGEQGRGFAVVADEVRKLAEKSSSSANEIDQVTQQITNQSTQVMSAIEEGLRHLTRSQEDVGSVASVLQRTSGGILEVNLGVDQISDATQAQQKATREVSESIGQIAEMAQMNTQAVNSVVDAARQLEDLAHGLADAVGRFRLGSFA
ncbi:methyl-accepting chemotaxis protein [Dechloromonas sp. ZS-1]|uniref:methyl-accepting chemotaxis protein n=1 Tax=Dechloromonas sp. ZS-1 TaxID=3138067 RepID=UPI0031FC413F